MNRKVLVIAVALMAVAMLALPISAVSATKPEKFVTVTFYGYPGVLFGGEMHVGYGHAGESDNYNVTWWDTDWCLCESYIPLGGDPPTFFIPQGKFAEGHYDGLWILHGYDPITKIGRSVNVHGIYDMVVTKWNNVPVAEPSNLVFQGVANAGINKVNILSGTINGQKVHGGGTQETVISMALYKFELTIHFEP